MNVSLGSSSSTLSPAGLTLSGAITPSANNAVDVGTSGLALRDLYVTGTFYGGAIVASSTATSTFANGISLIIEKALELPEQFLTKLTNGKTLGEEALLPARSYVALVEALLDEGVEIHTLLPGTGDGVGKIAFDKRPFTYRIRDWPEVPELFHYYHEELQVAIGDCLKTFNWGVGYYIFAPHEEMERIVKLGTDAGYGMTILGVVEKGERQVIFEPASTVLSPPGE